MNKYYDLKYQILTVIFLKFLSVHYYIKIWFLRTISFKSNFIFGKLYFSINIIPLFHLKYFIKLWIVIKYDSDFRYVNFIINYYKVNSILKSHNERKFIYKLPSKRIKLFVINIITIRSSYLIVLINLLKL
jgi:hypothetical protein